MTEPILIIHGVNNHEDAAFLNQVQKLQQVLGAQGRLIPVFWGDLGGRSADLSDCLPLFEEGKWRVRSLDEQPLALSPQTVQSLVGRSGTLGDAQRADVVSAQVRAEPLVRGDGPDTAQQVKEAVSGELGATQILKYVDDQETLAIVGRAIDAVLREALGADAQSQGHLPVGGHSVGGGSPAAGGYAVRGDSGPLIISDTRGLLDPIKRITVQVLHGIDETLGRMLANQLGRLNQSVRAKLADPIAGTLGDIMRYQRHAGEIQQRLHEAIAKEAPGFGGKDKPISVIAHSLGGVISFDAAMNPASEDKRLWIKSFITFGSQSAFFHIVDPRVPALPPYQNGAPVRLKPSIRRWTNLWDPLDLLAFTAGTVFRLADDSVPTDIAVQESASVLVEEKLWAHSVYWESKELADALRTEFR